MIHLIQVLQISWFHARRSRRIENLCARRENLIVLRPISIVLSLSIIVCPKYVLSTSWQSAINPAIFYQLLLQCCIH
jgi:hypothetical protein